MNRSTHHNHSSRKIQSRIARVQDKLQKLRDRVRRSTALFWERRQARLTWWQQAFRTPMSAGRWVFSQAKTLWAAFMAILGLKTKANRLLPRGSSIRANKSYRQSYTRGLLMSEGLEQRQLLAADLYVGNSDTSGGNTIDFAITSDPGSDGFSTGDTVTWLGADQAIGGTGANADISGLIVGTNAFNSIQAAINAPTTGDTVHVAPGTYSESPSITESLTLKSVGGRDVTTIQLQTGPTYTGALTVSGAGNDVTVEGFTIEGRDGTPAQIAASNIYIDSDLGTVQIKDNLLKVGQSDPASSTGDDGFGLVSAYNTGADTNQLTVTGNKFEPLTAAGTRAFYINPGVDQFDFSNNEIVGDFQKSAVTQAKDSTIANNVVTGTGASAGLATWGYPDATIYGHATFTANTISGTGTAISLFDSQEVTIENNILDGNGKAIALVDYASVPSVDITTININDNSLDSTVGITNAFGTPVDATGNWFGTASSAGVAGKNTGPVTTSPYLGNGTDTDLGTAGFQGDMSSLVVPVGASLQAAIDAAPAGSTLNVEAGTYLENIIINKPLTISGPNAGIASSGVRGPESTLQGGILVTSSSVTIDGLKIVDGRVDYGFQRTGVFISGPQSNVAIKNSLIDLLATPSESSVHGIVTTYGASTNGLLVTGNAVSGWEQGIYLNPGVQTSSISNNSFSNNGNHIIVDDPNGLTIASNSFVSSVGSQIGVGAFGASVDLEAELGLTGNSFDTGTARLSVFPYGGAGQSIQGTLGADSFRGDYAYPANQNQTYEGRGGNDVLKGGSGMDTAIFTGNFADYTITSSGGTTTVTDNIPARDGTDTLSGIEVLQFVDVSPTIVVGTSGVDAFNAIRNGSNLEVYLNSVLVQTIPLSSANPVILLGGDENDSFTFDFSAGNPIPVGGVQVQGNGNTATPPGDRIVLTGGSAGTVVHSLTNASDGSISVDGAMISYTGLEPVLDLLVVANRTFTFGGGAENITLGAGSGADYVIDSPLAEAVTFTAPTVSLTINGGTGDTLAVNTAVPSVNVAANVPTVTLNANIGGAVSGTASTVNVNSPGSVQDGVDVATAGAILTIGAGTYTESIQVTKNLTIKGATGIASDVVLNGSTGGVNDGVITIAAPPVTSVVVQGLTLTASASRHGIRAAATTALTLTVDNVIAKNNSQYGIAVSGPVTLAITNSKFSGNGSGGVGTFTGLTSASVTGSNFSGQTNQVFNSSGAGKTIDASGNYFGTTNPASVTTSGNVDYTPMLAAAPTGTSADFNTLIVHKSGSQVGATGRIAEGQALLNPAGTLQVRGGSYGENASVDDYKFSPGSSPAIVTVGGYTQLAAGTALMEINGTVAGTDYDQINVNVATAGSGSGLVSLDGTLSLVFGYIPAPGQSWTLINNDGSDPVTGTFATPVGTTFTGTLPGGGLVPLTLNYAGGDGNDVVVSVTTFSTLYAAAGVGTVNSVFTLTADNDLSGTITTGDGVTFTAPGSTPVTGLLYGYQAFATIQNAIAAAAPSTTIHVAGYTTLEDTPPVAISGLLTGGAYSAISTFGTAAGFDGSLTISGSNTFNYTVAPNAFGPETFNVSLTDGASNTIFATVTLDVLPVNDQPTFSSVSNVSVAEDSGAFSGSVASSINLGPANEVPPQTATFSTTYFSGPTGLFATPPAISPSGVLTFTTFPNANGTAVYSVVLNDGGNTTNGGVNTSTTHLLTITLTPVNDAPVAVDDSGAAYTTLEDTALTVAAPGVLFNDTDIDGDTLTAHLVTNPANGTVVLNTNGSFTYTPTSNFFGTDTFVYKVNDGTVDSVLNATVTISVTSVNDAPVAINDTATVAEDGSVTINVRSNDTDVEDTTPTGAIAVVTGPAHGSVSISSGNFVYTPAGNYNGPDSFTYTVQDSNGATSNTATVNITVTPVDDPVVAVNYTIAAINEDTTATGNVLASVVNLDPLQDTLSASVNAGPANGSLSLATNGAFTYTPNPNFNGSDSFTYDVTDGHGVSTGTVFLTVNAVNDAPVNTVPTAALSTPEDTPLVFSGANKISVADVDVAETLGGQLKVTLESFEGITPAGLITLSGTASLVVTGNGSSVVTLQGLPVDVNAALNGLSYTPTSLYHGPASIKVTTNDLGNTGIDPLLTGTASSEEDIDVISFTVSDVNNPPTATNGTANVLEDGSVSITIAGAGGISSDVDGSIVSVTAGAASHGTAVVSGLSVVYTPTANYFGTDSFSYTVTDDDGATATAVVTVNVRQLNDAPVANPDFATLNEDDPATTINVLANDNAGPLEGGQALSIVGFGAVSGVLAGSFTFTSSTITFTPPANFSGTATLEYIIQDNGQDSNLAGVLTNNFKQATGLLTITVNPDSDAPTLTVAPATGNEDTAIPLNITAAKTDPSEVLSDVTITGVPAGAALSAGTNNGGGNWTVPVASLSGLTITPPLNDNSDFTLTVSVSSTDSPDTPAFSTGTILVTVIAVNDKPVITVPGAQTIDEDTDLIFTGATAISVVDVDAAEGTGDIQVTLTVPVAKGTLTLGSTPGTLTSVSGNGGATVVIVGKPADITTALDGLKFHSATDKNGPVTLNIQANDLGNSPTPAQTDAKSVLINVTPLPDAPVANNDSYTANEDNLPLLATPNVLANDTDADGDTLTVAGATSTTPLTITTTAGGTVTLNQNGSFSYSPPANYAGADSFSYSATDGVLTSTPAVVNITVNPVNDAPIAPSVSISAVENTAVNFDLKTIASDLETPVGSLSFASVSPFPTALEGTLTAAANGAWTFTPASGFTGNVTIGYSVTDTGQGVSPFSPALTSSGVLTIVVAPYNDPPVNKIPNLTLNPTAATIAEDNSLTFTTATVTEVSVNDIDVGSGELKVTLSVGNGKLVLASGSGVLITAGLDNSPTVTFTGTQAQVNAALNGLVYTPNADYNGSDTFTIVTDDQGNTGAPGAQVDSDSFTITITPVADNPIARNDTYAASGLITVPAASGVLNHLDGTETVDDSDADGDTISVYSVGKDSGSLAQANVGVAIPTSNGGSVTLNANGSFTYDPTGAANFKLLAAGQTGTDSFVYVITDNSLPTNLQSGVATVTINWTGVNDAPVAVGDSLTVAEDSVAGVSNQIDVKANDFDPDQTSTAGNGSLLDPATVFIATGPTHGTATVGALGVITYIPFANYNGPDSFTYTIKDDAGLVSAPAVVNITVTPVNDAPVGVAETYSAIEDTPLIIAAPGVLANDTDIDGDTLTAQLVSATNGTVLLNANGGFTFTPAPDFNGVASFTYRAKDPSGALSAPTVVTINVANVNDAPVAVNDGLIAVTEDTPITFSVLGNDTDADGNGTIDPTTVAIGTPPTKGSVSVNPTTGAITYTPTLNATGADSFTYTVKDVTGAISNAATVTLNITNVNDAPVANDDTAYAVNQGGTLSVPLTGVLTNDTDVDGDVLSAVLVGTAPAGLTLNSNGSFNFVLPASGPGSYDYLALGESATVSFQYKANDGLLDSNVANVTITIHGTNDQPVASAAAYTMAEDSVLNGTLAATDIDVTDNLVFSSSPGGLGKGSVVINPTTGAFTYTPNPGANGSDFFNFKVTDDSGAGNAVSVVKAITINITPVNSVPTFDIANVNVTEDSGAFSATQPVSNVTPGPIDEAGQAVTFTMVQTGGTPGLFSAGPAMSTAGVLSFTPTANAFGSATFDVTATDNGVPVKSTTKSFTITVAAVDDPTTASPLNLGNINEDTPVTFTAAQLIAQGNDPDNTVTLTSVSLNSGSGTLSGPVAGVYTFTPSPEWSGAVVIDFTVTGSTAASSTVNFTYVAVNDAPVLTLPTSGLPTGTEGDVLGINGVSVADVDVGGGNMTLDITSTNGTVSLTTPGSVAVASITNGIRLTGTLVTLNAALAVANNLKFTVGDVDPGAAATAPAVITFLVSDMGNYPSPAMTASGSITLTVTDKAPALMLTDNSSPTGQIDEGSTYILNIGGYADGGFDAIQSLLIRWGDGSTPTTISNTVDLNTLNTGGTITVTHFYADDPAGPNNAVDLKVDAFTQGNALQFLNVGSFTPARTPSNLTVNNVAPTVTQAAATSPLVVGQNGTFQVLASDVAGVNDPLIYSFDWDYNGVTPAFDTVGSNSLVTIPASFITTAGSGVQHIFWRVIDGDGGVTEGVTNEDVLPVISFTVDDQTVDEDAGIITITVKPSMTIPAGVTIPITVHYQDFGATLGSDYAPSGSQVITFVPGDLAGVGKSVSLQIIDNAIVEGFEAVAVTLTTTYVPGIGQPVVDVSGSALVGITDDDTAFQVAGLKVTSVAGPGVSASAAWKQAFLDKADVDATGVGTGKGYSIPVGSSTQTKTLPWRNINRLMVTMSDDIDLSTVAKNVNVILHTTTAPGTIAISNISVVGKVMTIDLPGPLLTDSFRLEIQDSVKSTGGVALDGDFTNGSSSYPTGGAAATGTPLNNFNFNFAVQLGNANQVGITNVSDASLIFAALNSTPTSTPPGKQPYTIFKDVTGDGIVNVADASVVFSNINAVAPVTFPATVPPSSNSLVGEGEGSGNDVPVASPIVASPPKSSTNTVAVDSLFAESGKESPAKSESTVFDEALEEVLLGGINGLVN